MTRRRDISAVIDDSLDNRNLLCRSVYWLVSRSHRCQLISIALSSKRYDTLGPEFIPNAGPGRDFSTKEKGPVSGYYT
jgi:hypothetical protein